MSNFLSGYFLAACRLPGRHSSLLPPAPEVGLTKRFIGADHNFTPRKSPAVCARLRQATRPGEISGVLWDRLVLGSPALDICK